MSASTELQRLGEERRRMAAQIEREAKRDAAVAEEARWQLERMQGVAQRGGLAAQVRLRKPMEAVRKRFTEALASHKQTLALVAQLERLDTQIAALRQAQHPPGPAANAA